MYELYLSIDKEDFELVAKHQDIYDPVRWVASKCKTQAEQLYTNATVLDAYITDKYGNVVFIAHYDREGI